jgi:hypothetical protein
MDSTYVNASYGNKKFIVSVLSALEELRADDFVQLYLQAQNPSIYKHKPEVGDVHTALLAEISDNARLFQIEKERGAIILQAVYSAPSIANSTKALVMLMVGATLEYDDFVSRFGSGGDLEAQPLDPKSFSQFNVIYHAFKANLSQSDDVRFLIDKVNMSKTLFRDINAAQSRDTMPLFLAAKQFNFTQDSFVQFFESVEDEYKAKLVGAAPQGFLSSDYFAGIVANGFVPNVELEHITALFKAGRVDAFETLLPHLFTSNGAYDTLLSAGAMNLFFGQAGKELTEDQAQMQASFRLAFNGYMSSIIKGEQSPTNMLEETRYGFIRDFLLNALIVDGYDDFSRVLKEAVDANPVKDGQDMLEALYLNVIRFARREIAHRGASENLKSMLNLVKDAVVERMNASIDLVNQLPALTPESLEKEDRKFQGSGPQYHRELSHGPRH